MRSTQNISRQIYFHLSIQHRYLVYTYIPYAESEPFEILRQDNEVGTSRYSLKNWILLTLLLHLAKIYKKNPRPVLQDIFSLAKYFDDSLCVTSGTIAKL